MKNKGYYVALDVDHEMKKVERCCEWSVDYIRSSDNLITIQQEIPLP